MRHAAAFIADIYNHKNEFNPGAAIRAPAPWATDPCLGLKNFAGKLSDLNPNAGTSSHAEKLPGALCGNSEKDFVPD